MLTNSVLPINSRFTGMPSSARRVSHGGLAFSSERHLRQPQDGVQADLPGRISSHSGLGAEPEDAGLTGSTRSLFRRVMGLNVLHALAPTEPTPFKARRPQRAKGTDTEITKQVA